MQAAKVADKFPWGPQKLQTGNRGIYSMGIKEKSSNSMKYLLKSFLAILYNFC